VLSAPSTSFLCSFFIFYWFKSTFPYLVLSYPTLSYPTLPYPILNESDGTAQHSTAQHSTAPSSLTSLLNQRWKIFNFYFARSTWHWSCGLHCTVLHFTALYCTVLSCMAEHCIDYLRPWHTVDKDTSLSYEVT
jgi:hypothetical protein